MGEEAVRLVVWMMGNRVDKWVKNVNVYLLQITVFMRD